MKRLVKPFLYATAVMLVSVSCEKKDPTSCGSSDNKFRYIKSIKNARADLYQSAGFVIEGEGTRFICPSQLEKFSTYENTYILNQPQPFKYRIWGRAFNCDSCPTLVAGPSPFIVIDKIEKID
ncbi:hypothetical protein FHS57_004886 [Runella defluvii]|uniref:Lipoprotein n=1 Tax=Runella defluvii TaxID=370973 RepID=A0A7W5ZQF8_9BACT|nr:hypothetical protein [Runella defluvii]MBB3840865.1 hypothetical protein [Runella defluvii]